MKADSPSLTSPSSVRRIFAPCSVQTIHLVRVVYNWGLVTYVCGMFPGFYCRQTTSIIK